ncbi:hypothetical protein EK0264_07015 [Epidermidibacterium keratini]|uniref:Acyl-CoA dehydrogenase/oxidase C-terminal domain-containing protein n=1 Tax=Epidermidibacterium keratini TaxID=1891644 RepID=A0A7L4YLX6_9ACTN|nr:acyl-CoA dehydrogenase family protein [Epidermidibacterium keratini]QHC00052.1 hypothetical protein EK0264_07015 [Epidermidibacterium keratini]
MTSLASRCAWGELSWPELIEQLLALGRTDIPLARLTEGHIDAVRILTEAGLAPQEGLYGVWASRSGGTGVRGTHEDQHWVLDGKLRFASGAGVIDRALLPVEADGQAQLLDVGVRDWEFEDDWRTPAMAGSRSFSASLDGLAAEARAVGPDDFYLSRTGFHPGGIGVAAVWVGGAQRVLDLLERARARRSQNEITQARLGRARLEIASAAAACRQGAVLVDKCPPEQLRQLATECRGVTGAAVRRILTDVRELAGPAGLAYEQELSAAIDDLQMYVGQQNADSDAMFLGAPS